MQLHEVRDRIRAFIVRQFPRARRRALEDTDALLESGVLDSQGVLELVAYLEEEFGITIAEEDLVMENFQTIERMTAFVREKREGTPGPVSSEVPR